MIIGLMLISLAVLIAGGLLSVIPGGKGASAIGVASSLIGAGLAFIPAVAVLWTGDEASMRLAWQVPFGSFYIAIDPLSAFFITAISIMCALSAIYGTSYLKPYSAGKNLGAVWCFFNLLFASMLLVVLSRNGILFLIAWESMSLSSFFLVMFEHEKPEVREAGWIYLTAAHVGQACLMVLFIILAGQNQDLDFDRIIAPAGAAAAGTLFILAAVGFGSKAGFLPLHVWLPDAHPAAPSHVSAVMSGVMIKTGIYGIVRMISLMGAPAQWWGYTLIVIGALSGITGVIFAIAQHDIKRLLAYSSVENVGIITMGLGLWLLGTSTGNTVIATLGLMGGLLHVLNHALFKGLLFFGAGAVARATHSRDMDLMGGLMKRMPKTAIAFGIGSAAICGLPPLNGFISEFLIYLGAFRAVAGGDAAGGPVAGGLIALIALGFIGGLAAVCFTKVFGTVFLGEPRGTGSANACEAPAPMLWAIAVPAVLCLVLGIAAPLALRLVTPVVAQLAGYGQAWATSSMVCSLLLRISIAGGLLIIVSLSLWGLRSLLLQRRVKASAPTWDCGYIAPTGRMQYTSSSFTWPVTNMFRWVARPALRIGIRKGYFPHYAELSSHTDDIFKKGLFAPVFRSISNLAQRVHALQEGRNQLYVLYIAITILVLLLVKVR